jgi:hypothetical protein
LRQPLPEIGQHPPCIDLILEPHDEVVRVTHDRNSTASISASPLVDPKLEDVMQEDVGKERADYALNAKDNFHFERKIFGWRQHHCVLDLRRKR